MRRLWLQVSGFLLKKLKKPKRFALRPQVFTSVDGVREITAFNTGLAEDMLALHNACVRETLSASEGERGCRCFPVLEFLFMSEAHYKYEAHGL